MIVTYDPRSGVICAVSNESEGSTEPESAGDSGNPGDGNGNGKVKKLLSDILRAMEAGQYTVNGVTVRPVRREDFEGIRQLAIEYKSRGFQPASFSGAVTDSQGNVRTKLTFGESLPLEVSLERPEQPSSFVAIKDGEVIGYFELSFQVQHVDRTGGTHSDAASEAVKILGLFGRTEAGPAMDKASLDLAHAYGAGGIQAPLGKADDDLLRSMNFVLDPNESHGEGSTSRFYRSNDPDWLEDIFRWSAYYNGKSSHP